ncbi:hypothetical protein [Primorskyibacter flagellatus]|uniref:hypothetical protein n=1 Tax=Primorskyibacter flagellatus TaxID=1387277 RepID=UPI003A912077
MALGQHGGDYTGFVVGENPYLAQKIIMARNCLKHRVATSPGLKHTVIIGASGGIGAALVLKHALRLSPSDPPRQSSCKRCVMA